MRQLKKFIQKETVLFIAALCAIGTMLLVPPDGEYLHYIDFRVLCLLLCLMAVVAGFKSLGAFDWLTYQLLRRIKSGRVLGVTLVLLPFFCSMLVTNDVALIVFVIQPGLQRRHRSPDVSLRCRKQRREAVG